MSSIVFAADTENFEQHAITATQRRPINGLGTVFYNKDPYRADFFQNSQGVYDYTVLYPAEKQQFKFYGTTGYQERILRGSEVLADEVAQQDAYYNQRRTNRIQVLQDLYEIPFIIREQNTVISDNNDRADNTGEQIYEGYIPKFGVYKKGANYPAIGPSFYWPVVNNNIIDDSTINAIRTHAMARTNAHEELYYAYLAGLQASFDPLRVANDIPFTYSDNAHLRESQLPNYAAHRFLPFYAQNTGILFLN